MQFSTLGLLPEQPIAVCAILSVPNGRATQGAALYDTLLDVCMPDENAVCKLWTDFLNEA